MAMALRLVDGLWSHCTSLVESGQFFQARPLLQRLLQLEIPQTMRADASLMLADLLRYLGEYQMARRHVSAALAGDPGDASLHHMLGYLHHEDDEGNTTRALKHLRQAVKLAPDSSECHRALGEHMVHHASSTRGLDHLRQALELEPENIDSLRSLVLALAEQEKIEEARQILRQYQFRMGKAHPAIQTLWNELAYQSVARKQEKLRPVATVPMLKAVQDRPKKRTTTARPEILRFDTAHQQKSRALRPAPKK